MMEETNNYVGYKILLKPTEDQIKIFNKYFGVRNYVYNWGIDQIESHYIDAKNNDSKYKLISYYDLASKLAELKTQDETKWLNEYNADSLRMTLLDLIHAYRKFFNGLANKPTYHTKKFSDKSFYVRHDRMHIHHDMVYLPSIGNVSIGGNVQEEVIGYGDKNAKPVGMFYNMVYRKYVSPRVIFDGHKYYLTFSMKCDDSHKPSSCNRYKCNEVWQYKEPSDVIGIDVGCKLGNWFTLSDGTIWNRPSQSNDDERIKGYQKKFARQLNSLKNDLEKRGIDYNNIKKYYTKSMEETLENINRIEKKITNRKKNEARELANYLLKQKPKAVVFEDFKIQDWYVDDENMPTFVRERINDTIKDSMLYTARQIIVDTLKANDIPVIYADKEYPSTQLCSNCGSINKITLDQKIYRCECCGLVIDRDDNASRNLKRYGENMISTNKHIDIA